MYVNRAIEDKHHPILIHIFEFFCHLYNLQIIASQDTLLTCWNFTISSKPHDWKNSKTQIDNPTSLVLLKFKASRETKDYHICE